MTDELRFAKYEGTGNDFVMVVDLEDERPITAEEAAQLCDRRFGIGADGLIRIVRSGDAALFMDYRNADGSVAEMCGNGVRCVAALARDAGLIDMTAFDVATRAGIRRVDLLADGRISVEMGHPAFAKSAIPMRGPAWETFLAEPFDIGGGTTVKASALSMGNPHLVLLIEDDPDRYHVSHIGPALEHHELFPERGDRHAGVGAGIGRDDGVRQRRVCGGRRRQRGRPRAGADHGALPRRRPRGRAPRGRRGPADRTRLPRVRGRGGPRRAAVTDLAERLLSRTLALIDIASTSGDEAEILEALEVPGLLPVQDAADSVRWFGPPARRDDAPLVLLAGA